MDELLATLFAMPTLPWTCLVIASVVYWLTVILGALDLDVLGERLQQDGLAQFATAFGKLLELTA